MRKNPLGALLKGSFTFLAFAIMLVVFWPLALFAGMVWAVLSIRKRQARVSMDAYKLHLVQRIEADPEVHAIYMAHRVQQAQRRHLR